MTNHKLLFIVTLAFTLLVLVVTPGFMLNVDALGSVSTKNSQSPDAQTTSAS